MGVTFTESEYLILSSLPYGNKFKADKFDKSGYPIPGQEIDMKSLYGEIRKRACEDNKELEALLDKNGNWTADASKYKGDYLEYKKAIDSLIKKLDDNNFKISKCVNHNTEKESGFLALAIEPQPNTDNEVFVCCRGSDGLALKNKNDWIDADVALLANEMTDQQAEMAKFMHGMEKYDGINITGHSLGGNLAMFGAVIINCPQLIKGVYSFDGPGFNPEFISIYNDTINKIKSKIHNFQAENDMISSCLKSIGTIEIIKTQDIFSPLGHHRWLFTANSDGNLKNNLTGHKFPQCDRVNVTSNSAAYIANNPIDIANKKNANTGCQFSYEIHDFSPKNCEAVLAAIDGIERAQFTSLNDWKQYYQCGWFLKSSAKYIKEKIEDYYDNLSSANHNNKLVINKLFGTMNKIDEESVSDFSDISNQLKKLADVLNSDYIYRIRIK